MCSNQRGRQAKNEVASKLEGLLIMLLKYKWVIDNLHMEETEYLLSECPMIIMEVAFKCLRTVARRMVSWHWILGLAYEFMQN